MISIRTWLDQLEGVLGKEAELAGLLGHSTMIGSAREFFIRRVLRSVVPYSIHVGTGRVLSSDDGEVSRQVDIIVYDPRFPLLEVERGVGMYFVEGVIAAIEVKSRLDHETLQSALDNCASVMELGCRVCSADDLNRYATTLVRGGMDLPRAEGITKWGLTPRTYIFAYNSSLSEKAVCERVDKWYTGRGESASPEMPFLPRVISAPRVVGIQNDPCFTIDPGDVREKMTKQYGRQAMAVMGVWPTTHHFGWLALHLMHAITDRLGTVDHATGVRLTLDQHLRDATAAYFKESMENKEAHYLFWTGRTQGGVERKIRESPR